MTERSATIIFNKPAWGPGPWQDEPDVFQKKKPTEIWRMPAPSAKAWPSKFEGN